MCKRRLTFIHGFMGHSSDWDEIRDALPEFETRALDVEPASDWQSSLKQLADQIDTPTVLVGYSMGARLSLGLAIEYPSLCEGLIFVSGNPGLESEEDRVSRSQTDEEIAARIASGNVEQFLEQWYQSNVFASLSPEARQAEIKRKLAQSADNWPETLRCNSVSRQPNYWPRLIELQIPAVMVAGEDDEKYREIAVRFGSSKVIPDCGHIVHREHPNELVRIIREFR